MGGYNLMALLLVGVRFVACSPTPIDDLTINLNLRETLEDEGAIDYETFDEDQEMKAGQTPLIIPVVIGGLYVDQENVFFQEKDEFYSPSSEQWEDMPNPLMENRLRSGIGVATLDNEIYMAGGTGSKTVRTVLHRSLNGNWQLMKNLPQIERNYPTLTRVEFADKQSLVVTGGKNIHSKPLNSVEIYRKKQGGWVPHPNMIEAHAGHAAVLLNERLYVLGGDTGRADGKPSEKTEFFNPLDPTWKVGPTMNEKRSFHGATVLGGNIYICGGQKAAGAGEPYDILQTCEYGNGQGPYTPMASMIHVRTSFAMLTVGEEIWAIGGIGGYTSTKPYLVALDTVEKYDSGAGKWIDQGQKLQKPRYLFGATTVTAPRPHSLESANRSMNNRTG